MKYEKCWIGVALAGIMALLALAVAVVYANPPYEVYGNTGENHGRFTRVNVWTGQTTGKWVWMKQHNTGTGWQPLPKTE